MKLLKLTTSLFLGCLLTACGSESDITPGGSESGEKVKVSVGVTASDSFVTKALGNLDTNTDNVESVQIYVFRENGTLDAFAEGDNDEAIEIEVTKGQREFFAIANPQNDFVGITQKSIFLNTVAKLEKEKGDRLLMVGTDGMKDIQSAQNIEIVVTRFASRIQLQYSVDFSGTPWEGKTFTPDSVYITNAHSEAITESGLDASIAATTPIHGGWYGQNASLCDVNPKNNPWGETPAPIGGEKWFSYYVYKNDQPADDKFANVTSLVICGYIEGDDQLQYYTVRINTPDANITGGDEDAKYKYVQNNVIYGIKATIKGTGTPDPETEPVNLHVTVTPKPWTEIWQEVEFK